MKQVLFLSKGEFSASTRYRASSYFPALKRAGWSPSHLNLHEGIAAKLHILKVAKKSDVVVVLRHGLSFPFLHMLRACSRKLVFDFDDAIFLKSSGKSSSVRAQRFDNTIGHCDQVWAGNHYLAERARMINPITAVMPTAVDMTDYQSDVTKPESTIDLVWIGSSSTGKYLRDLLPTLEKAAIIAPRLRLKIIADFTLHSDVLPIHNVPWSRDCEVAELMSAHIGIAPMPETPWTRGKCALKVLQYMASRLPVISSDVGANAEIIQHNKTGLLVSTEQDWVDGIVLLANSAAMRERMGAAGYVACDKNYSLQQCTINLLSELEGLLV